MEIRLLAATTDLFKNKHDIEILAIKLRTDTDQHSCWVI